MNKSVQPILIMLSVFALLNVMFVPIFDVWGGLFPSNVDYNFFDVIKMIFKEGRDAWRHWVVLFTITIFVPSLMMLVASLSGKKGFFVTINIIGILLWIRQIVDYGIDNDFDYSFDFEDGNVSIGTWIAIGIFVISLIIALSSRRSIPNTAYQMQPQYYQAQPQAYQPQSQTYQPKSQDNQPQTKDYQLQPQAYQQPLETSQLTMPEHNIVNYCSKCGAKTEGGSFCTKCGTKLF